MAVLSQSGVVSWGAQTQKESVAATFYKHRAVNVDLGPMSDDRVGPPEVGGVSTPTIPYRGGLVVGGGFALHPRLAGTFGWLLHGATGAWTVATNKDVLDNTVTGMYKHTFTFNSDEGLLPYMSLRKHIPGSTSTNDEGETYLDCKIISLAVTLPNDGLIASRVDALGRKFEFDDNPSWNYGNTNYEDGDSVPLSVVTSGYLKVPGFSGDDLPIVGATVTLANAPLDLRQERVYGDPYIEDVTVVLRTLTVDLILKWRDPQFYNKILTGSTTGTQWSPQPFTADLDVVSMAPHNAILTTPWGLRIQAPELMYQINGPITLAGGQSIMMAVRGTALANETYYVKYHLGNLTTTYAWPT